MSMARNDAGRPAGRAIRGTDRLTAAGWPAAALLALALGGCAGGMGGGDNVGPMGGGNTDGQGIFGSSMETTTVAPTASGGSSTGAGGANQFADSDFDCPKVEVRGGASVWQVKDQTDGALRYQANLARFSRECRFTSPEMNVRVGIQGRVLLGAKGAATSLTVPIRVAVVEEGPTPKPVWTRLYMVPVQIGAEVMQVDFSMVAEEVTFTRPDPGTLERYIIYVGFDSQAGEAEARQKPKPRQSRPAPQAAAPRPSTPRPAATPAQTAAPRPAAPAQAAAPRPAATPPATQPAAAPAASPSPASTTAAQSPAQAAAPRPAAPPTNTQWIGAPAPSAGGFVTPAQ